MRRGRVVPYSVRLRFLFRSAATGALLMLAVAVAALVGEPVAAAALLAGTAGFIGWWAWQYLGRSYLCIQDGYLTEVHRGEVKSRVDVGDLVGFELDQPKRGFPDDVWELHLKVIARAKRADGYSTPMWSLASQPEHPERLQADIARVMAMVDRSRTLP
ncbi:MAG: hypothetical protein JHD16_12000 [Solirubrobacteraceae bacterium]|nr:hypothetical protein [Solirubrobacteraceae bacterium]